MSVPVSNHISTLQSYKPGQTIAQLKAELGLDEIAVLWNNENPLGTSPKAAQRVQEVLQHSYRYPDPMSLELRTAIAKRLKRKAENIMVGNGGEGVLMNMLRAFCSGKDELLTSAGSFVIIYIWSQIQNVPCRQVPLTTDYRFDIPGIVASVTEKTKIIYLANANNPTGTMITETELRFVLDNVPSDVLIMVDEAYFEFSKGLKADFPDTTQWAEYPNLLTLRSFSKAYGIAAMRVGYAIGHADLVQHLLNVKLTFEPSNLAQAAGLGCLEDETFLQQTIQNNNEGLCYFYTELERLGIFYTPSFANFVMVDLQNPERAQEVVEALQQRGVLVRLLAASGLPHCVRISVGTAVENELCIKKIKEVL